MEPSMHRFFSISAKYNGSLVEDLELTIQRYGQDVVRMQLTNRLHGEQCKVQFKRFLTLTGVATIYFSIAININEGNIKLQQAHILYPALLYLLLVISILRTTLDLVQSERLFYSWDMALQTETVRTFGRGSVLCVQRGNLHDMVLNEVIENLDVKYMLIVRTKGSLFRERPIIPLFNSLSPSFECLQHIQRNIQSYWLNNFQDSVSKNTSHSRDIPSLADS